MPSRDNASLDVDHWNEAVQSEMDFIFTMKHENYVHDLWAEAICWVQMDTKQIFKKLRLVPKGFIQKEV
jgi:hypothetical protein